jgi:hypothetical protein
VAPRGSSSDGTAARDDWPTAPPRPSYTKRLTNASAVSATSRQPLSIVSE